MNLDEIRTHLQNAKDAMARSPGDTLVQQGYVRNLIALAETELKIHELDKTDTAIGNLVEIVRKLDSTAGILNDAATKAEKSSRNQERQTNAIIFWTAALFLATATMAYYAHQQIKEAQNLTLATQEQVDLQLRPGLMIKTEMAGGKSVDLELVNFGNGPAVNIKISSDDGSNAFISSSPILDSKQKAPIYVVNSPVDKNNLTEKETAGAEPFYAWGAKKELILNISYMNIDNLPYFSKIRVSKFKSELISMGELN
jgi:hypothetical protein